jgi:hypothetical protein
MTYILGLETSLAFGKEIWRSSLSVPGLLVSSKGRIMSEPVYGVMPHGGTRIYRGKPWYGAWAVGSGGGKYIFRLRGKTYKVARLVCEAFNGPQPSDKPVTMHLDENSRNNLPDNLAWGTQKQNLNAPGFIEYCEGRTGENNPRIKGDKKKLK